MPFFIIMGIVINLKKNIYNLMLTQFTAYSLQLISPASDILSMCIGNDVEDDIIFYDVYFDVNIICSLFSTLPLTILTCKLISFYNTCNFLSLKIKIYNFTN